ncbi:MAG: hypothetical protein D6820_14720 [Lentisphaerae bacterium]|nr:MAG: hypothetical protein D6820_14720 [Lentisphaerota bacterium]
MNEQHPAPESDEWQAQAMNDSVDELLLLEDELKKLQPKELDLRLQHQLESIPGEWDRLSANRGDNEAKRRPRIHPGHLVLRIAAGILFVTGLFGWWPIIRDHVIGKGNAVNGQTVQSRPAPPAGREPQGVSGVSSPVRATPVAASSGQMSVRQEDVPLNWKRVTTGMKEYGTIFRNGKRMRKMEWHYIDTLQIQDPERGKVISVQRPGQEIIFVSCDQCQ